MEITEWILFTPQIPTTPTSLRTMIWRRLQSKGALNLPNGVWLLPRTPEHEHFITLVVADVEKNGGSGWFFISQAGDDRIQQRLIIHFQLERHHEYVEYINSCQLFLQKIDRAILAKTWTFQELEENEQDLQKLNTKLPNIQRRDFFPNSDSEDASLLRAQCSQALYEFARDVYTYQATRLSQEQANQALNADEQTEL